MSYLTEEIGGSLRAARERKGLSQRELARLAGVPQGQISKIENGTVDLRLSSLMALARALDLEPVLVPRRALPAVKAVARGAEPGTTGRPLPELQVFADALDALPVHDKAGEEYAKMRRVLRDLNVLPLSESDRETMRRTYGAFKSRRSSHEAGELYQAIFARLYDLRNRLAHGDAGLPAPARPAYSLEEDDDDG